MKINQVLESTKLHENLATFLNRPFVTKAGKFYTGSYVFNPEGYHLIDLYQCEPEGSKLITIILIDETEHSYKIKARNATVNRFKAEFVTIQEVIEFIDNFTWSRYLGHQKFNGQKSRSEEPFSSLE